MTLRYDTVAPIWYYGVVFKLNRLRLGRVCSEDRVDNAEFCYFADDVVENLKILSQIMQEIILISKDYHHGRRDK